jgi:tRNA(Ile)-lysidine synthase
VNRRREPPAETSRALPAMLPHLAPDLADRYPPRRKYLIGVSGGRDSVALLHALRTAGFRSLVVCHLNHGLRGRASGGDARFVRGLAEKWGFPCEIGRENVRALAKTGRLSLETAAREARHRFFAESARIHRCPRVFLAHHADDQVETVLHRICRGTGLAGLGGMTERSQRPPLEILRPLLDTWREDIDAYVAAHDLPWREDETNAETAHSTRNRWRHHLIPALTSALDRDPRAAVLRLSEIAQAEDEALDWWLDREWDTVAAPGEGGLRTATLLPWPVALQRRALVRWLKQENVPGLDFQIVEAVRLILPPDAPAAKTNLPGGRHARRRAGRVFLE